MRWVSNIKREVFFTLRKIFQIAALYKSKRLVQAARVVHFVEYRRSRSRFLSLFFRLERYITHRSIRKRDLIFLERPLSFLARFTPKIVRRTICDKRNQTGRSCLPCTECTFERLEHSASFGNFYILWCIQIDKLILRSTVLYYNYARTCIRAVCYNDACSKRIVDNKISSNIKINLIYWSVYIFFLILHMI